MIPTTDGDVARVGIPPPDDPRLVDRAMFVFPVARDADAPGRVRLSNVLALTLDARDSPR